MLMSRLPLAIVGAFHLLGAASTVAQSGVLIGVAKPGGYETLWIVRDASHPLRATIPNLLIPRADGWWRVGTVPICSTGGPEGQSMDVFWRGRADSTAVISEICHELPRGELPLPIYAEDSAARDSLSREIVRCSWSRIAIKFVSPQHVAVGETSGQTEECEPRGGRWYQSYYVSRFHGDSSLALEELAGPRVDSLARVALGRAAKELAQDELCTTLAEGFDPNELLEIGDQWFPTRAAGRWMPVVFNQIATGDCQLLPVVDVALSPTLTGHDALRPAWNVLIKGVKGLRDAFASPQGDLIVLRVADSLMVHLGDGKQLGRRIGAFPFPEREIVMIQWATGRHVARWDEEIAALMRRRIEPVRVVPAPKEP